jgi:hypothetical protein
VSDIGSNVIEIEFRPKPRLRPPAPKIAEATKRSEWKKAVRAFWADPANWRVSKNGSSHIEIKEVGVGVAIQRDQNSFWLWIIRWRNGREIRSQWVYVNPDGAFVSALDAVIALG